MAGSVVTLKRNRWACFNPRCSFFVAAQTPMTHASTLFAAASNPRVLPVLSKVFLYVGAVSACSSVVFSAAFAHLPVFAAGVPPAVQTALNQQQFHALGLLFTGLAMGVFGASRWLQAAGWLMLVGSLLFSFNIYARYVLEFETLRGLVPWGGAAWMVSWLCLGMAFKSRLSIAKGKS